MTNPAEVKVGSELVFRGRVESVQPNGVLVRFATELASSPGRTFMSKSEVERAEVGMADVSEHDRAIVEAAEKVIWAENDANAPGLAVKAYDELRLAVLAKREAQRPRCDIDVPPDGADCGAVATQLVHDPVFGSPRFRCDKHKIQVTDL